MLAELPGPMFWHLDGCNNDPDFAFSIFHRTREEWEAEERQYQEFNRRFDAERKEQKVLQLDVLRGSRSSYTDPDYAGGSPAIRLHALGVRLSELLVDLQQPHAQREPRPQSASSSTGSAASSAICVRSPARQSR